MRFPDEAPVRLTRPNVTRLVLPPGKSETIVFDDALPGFGVRVRAGGKRTWIAQYRLGTKQRRLTLGSVEAVDPDEARARAKRALAAVQLGNDPQAEKSQARARAAITLGSIAVRYLDHAKTRLRPRSYEEVERHLTRHWAPLRETPIHDVDRRKIAGRLDEIAKQHGPFASNRARASLSALFTWAMRQGEVEVNPVIATGKATDEISRDRVLSDQEIAAIWRACRDDDYGRIVRLLILTGQRREEVGAICWSEIDRTKRVWRLPMNRTKNGLPHDVPLSAQALDILESAPLRPGRDLIFGQGEGGFQGWSNSKAALDKRVSEISKNPAQTNKTIFAPWRLHDLRRTMVTQMNESLGILPHIVEAVVNHITGPSKLGVAGVYNRAGYAAEKKFALDKWASYISNDIKFRNQN